ncbi:MAG: zinc finger domain-containing protein [Anaerolineae bacterium]
MIELPEAYALSEQISRTLAGKRIVHTEANHSPHKFAWYYGEPEAYDERLRGHVIAGAQPVAGMVEVAAGDATIILCDGIRLRYLVPEDPRPDKHQLLVTFEDGSALVASVQMYGGMWCFEAGTFDNGYYQSAKTKPSPLTDAFDAAYYDALYGGETAKLSTKAFLATDQRIPGLGNGVLQDILFNARLNPKRKVATLTAADRAGLFAHIKATLSEMAAKGGRDTETDLSGAKGGYATILNSKTAGKPCPQCGTAIVKEAYLGGSVYYCPTCQPLVH